MRSNVSRFTDSRNFFNSLLCLAASSSSVLVLSVLANSLLKNGSWFRLALFFSFPIISCFIEFVYSIFVHIANDKIKDIEKDIATPSPIELVACNL